MTLPPSERAAADALLTDLYLDALLAARDRRASDVPAASDLDPAVRAVASRLAADLGRVHPSFRFEERLAARLAEAAARLRLALAAGGESATAPSGTGDPAGDPDPADDVGSWSLEGDPDGILDAHGRGRPLLIGGALTSAALSIAGAAAYVAWRRSRPPLTPMARAVRAIGQDRLAREPGRAPEGLD